MANAKSGPRGTLLQRQQVAEAVLQGYLDSVLASDLSTAKSNGYTHGQLADFDLTSTPIAGINR